MAGPIRISILANASQANAALADSESRFSRWGKGIAAATATAGLAVGAAVAAIGVQSVKAASDAQQSLGATETVFGKYADTVIKRSNEAAMAVGLSANEYRELSNVMGASLSGAGIPLEKVTSLTDQLNRRAADMSATFGGTAKEAVEAIGSLMRGEADPIERYGVSIKQADVNARLAAQGLDGLTGEALKQAEMQARLDLLMQKTAVTEGAFARESNTLAGQQQRLGAVWENLKAKIGTALLPALTSLATVAVSALNKLSGYGPQVRAMTAVLSERLRPALQKAREFLTSFGETVRSDVVPVARQMVATFTGTVVPALTAFGAYVSSKLIPVFRAVWSIVQTQVIPIVQSMALYFYGTLYPALMQVSEAVAAKLRPVFETLVQVFMTKVLPTVQVVLAKFREWQPTIQRTISVLVQIIGKVLEFAAAILAKVLPPVIRFAGFLIANVVPAVAGVIGVVIQIIAKVVAFGAALVTGVQKAGEFARGLGSKFNEAIAWVQGLPGRVTDAVGDLGRLLFNAGIDVIDGLWDGLKDKWGDVTDWFGSVTSAIPDLKGPPTRDRRLLEGNGVLIMQGLRTGLERGYGGVQRYLHGVTGELDRSSLGRGLARSLRRTTGWTGVLKATREDNRSMTITLTSQQVDQLSRGRSIAADLAAWQQAGGRAA